MKTPLRVALGIIGVVIAGAALSCWIGSSSAPARPDTTRQDAAPVTSPPSTAARAEAPSWTLPDLSGRERRLEEFRGQVVLLNFWATWCPPCREEIPDLVELQQDYQGRITVIGIAVDAGSARAVQAFVDGMGIQYPILLGDIEVAQRYRVMGIPASFLVDRAGRIVRRWNGPYPKASFARQINAVLAEGNATP